MRTWVSPVGTAVLAAVLGSGLATAAAAAETAGDPDVPVDQLEFMLKPLTAEELSAEAEAWFGRLKAKVREISELEIATRRQREQVEAIEESAEEAETLDEAAAERAHRVAEAKEEARTEIVEELAALRAERTALIDRLNTVLDAWEEKGGEVESYRMYVTAVSGVDVDVSDASATRTAIVGWLESEEGGLRWARNLAIFAVTILAFWVLSRILGAAVDRAVRAASGMSELLREFFSTTTRRVVMLVGILVAITALEINVNPVLAAIGGAAFVIAFALQGALGNFASGMLILAYRPFDVGDIVEAGGVSGVVDSMNLTSTYIRTFDNKLMIVPNNKIWDDVITNATSSDKRRVDMVFGIGYGDDIGKAQKILEEIVAKDERVLDDPAPMVRVHELGDSSVNFVCRPWVTPENYWSVYWDVTRAVKEEFDRQGVSIPFPQRDVHFYPASGG